MEKFWEGAIIFLGITMILFVIYLVGLIILRTEEIKNLIKRKV